MTKKEYSKQLQDPRWKAKRLEILQRDNHTCTQCGNNENLHVHHKSYIPDRYAWEYGNEYLTTLCSHCHGFIHGKVNVFEIDEKVNFYTNDFSFTLCMKLSQSGAKLLLYIMHELEKDKDYIWIDVHRYLSVSGTSLNTYKKAIMDLCKLNIVYPVVDQRRYPYVFWINPKVFFKGSRLKKYPDAVEEYVVKKPRAKKVLKSV